MRTLGWYWESFDGELGAGPYASLDGALADLGVSRIEELPDNTSVRFSYLDPRNVDHLDPVLDSIARECARGVRGCCTDERYAELVRLITRALQAERRDNQ